MENENIEITIPPGNKFMHVDMKDGKAIISFGNTCKIAYNLEVQEETTKGGWILPTERGDNE